MQIDRHRLYRLIQNISKRNQQKKPVDKLIQQLSEGLEQSIDTAELREKNIPIIKFDNELPINQKRELIAETINNNQIIVLCGETGSGKTTQLPKICLEIGRGIKGFIGHTQPRRLAARSVANRIAEELQSEVGNHVGFKVRFSDKLSDKSYIKLMTDGILLAECQHDPYLNQYDTIIIDEAHERSLNIDFLLGYLKRLLPKRPDLKIIITSATIDPERFSKHFDGAPIIEVSGRTYPVDVEYLPTYDDETDEQQKDLQHAISDAIDELSRKDRGDILVFLSGERDIRETADFLKKRQLQNTDILPLLARLSNAEQNKIFHSSNKRRIILSTNVAETSLTVPGIKYVIDSGEARISRYSWRSKIQRLPIEKISQASANQRKGRCGRVSHGTCIRLYSEDDFLNRAEFTEPEIQRTNLASVILQMENMQLGHVEDFPFVEPPDSRLINDGYKLLFELNAIDKHHKLTQTGKKLARLPIDPKLGRILIEAEKESALEEVLVIVSALAIQDPRERPLDKQQAADEAHKTFQDNRSDFLSYLNIWNRFHEQQNKISGNQLRKWCKQHYLSWMRMREWKDTHKQFHQMLKELKLKFNKYSADYAAIHKSLITGLLGNIGLKTEDKEYLGARNRKFYVFPGSGLFNKPPKCLLAAEIVETAKVYARTVANIELEWIEEKATHLFKKSYSDPHWEKRNASVNAFERTTLYGLVINPKKKIHYGPIDPKLSREIFIRGALVNGDFNCRENFFIENNKTITELENLEAKSRRQDIIVDDEIIYNFFDSQIPDNIINGKTFDKWLKSCNQNQINALLISKGTLMQHDASHITNSAFPDYLEINSMHFPLEYHFDPSHKRDGITLITPLAGLHAINPQTCEWLVPGMLHEKMTELIRSLPKQLRRNFVPAPNYADACYETLEASDLSLVTAMSNHLKKITGTEIPYDAWRPELLDSHLFMNYRVIDTSGKTLKESRDLASLQNSLEHHESDTSAHFETNEYDKDNIDASILDNLPQTIEIDSHGVKIKAYPTLVKEGKNIALRLLNNPFEHQQKHAEGLRQLFIKSLPDQIKYLRNNLPNIQDLCMKYASLGKCDDLKNDIINLVVDELFLKQDISSQQIFESILEEQKSKLVTLAEAKCDLLSNILDEYYRINKTLKKPPLNWLDAISDIDKQIKCLLPKHFLLTTEPQWLEQLPRYLKAISKRLDKIQDNPARDRQNRILISNLWDGYEKRHKALCKQNATSEQLNYYRWMLEEFRVSLFAQELKTLFPISEKRLRTYWNEISDA